MYLEMKQLAYKAKLLNKSIFRELYHKAQYRCCRSGMKVLAY